MEQGNVWSEMKAFDAKSRSNRRTSAAPPSVNSGKLTDSENQEPPFFVAWIGGNDRAKIHLGRLVYICTLTPEEKV